MALGALGKEENCVPSHLLAPSMMMTRATNYFLDSANCCVRENFAIFHTVLHHILMVIYERLFGLDVRETVEEDSMW